MPLHPVVESLKDLRLFGMAKAFQDQEDTPLWREMRFEERLELMLARERIEQDNRSIAWRLRRAHLGQQASFESIDIHQSRGLDRSLLAALGSCEWITEHHNILITGPTGVGKSYIACAFGHKACRSKHTVEYHRLGRLFFELNLARGEGRYIQTLKLYSKIEVLILDDWGLTPLSPDQKRDLLEILEDRHGRKSTIVTSQLPIDTWHEWLGNETLADAILDRLVHNSYNITLKGESMRKKLSTITDLP
jgi:DNA replication protein DnaC